MSLIRSKDSRPEKAVRSLVHRLGYRFRLHRTDLPGKPDLAFPGKKKVMFVHGCFWHRHGCPRGSYHPKTNLEYWTKKFVSNKERDKKYLNAYKQLGWGVLVIWECQIKDKNGLCETIIRFLKN